MRKIVICALITLQALTAWAQAPGGISGKVVDAKNQKPMQNASVSVVNTNLTQLTNINGLFTFPEVGAGDQVIQVKVTGYKEQLLPVKIESGKVLDIGSVVLEEDITSEQQLSLVTITETDLGDDNSGSENTAGLLQATRDVFQQAAAFNWGQSRFRIRGLDNEYGATMINGVMMNKIYDGRPQWSNWGGLNDATRNQEFTMGSGPSDYTFGGILGTQEINTRASIYRPGTRVSFSGTNTNYSWRAMATHASGLNKDGWAYVISGSRRWAQEGYFEGTDYSANSLFASVEKKFNDKHSLNLTAIYAQNSRGKNSPNTQEVTNLMGEEYNSYWGWQNGKKRNSRDKDVEEPLLILSHYWKFNSKTQLNTNLSWQTGMIGNSRLDFNDTRNPDPTYYRNLPSFYLTAHDADGNYTGGSEQNQQLAGQARAYFLANPQINWDRLYDINVREGESAAVLYEDRTDDTQITANSILSSQLSDNIALNAGVTYRKLRSENFQYLLDLLGGQYYQDIDPFLSGVRQQTDLDNPNRNVVEGDRFGYNYKLYAEIYDAFTQFKFTYNKFDFYLAQNFTRTQYQREGLYRNGNYPDNSKGKSKALLFENFGFKGGLTYKLSGQHYFDFNGIYMTKAPALRNVFPNARMNNTIVPDLKSEIITSADASYILRMPNFKARLTGYFSTIKNVNDISFYFAEGLGVLPADEEQLNANNNGNAFVAEIVSGLNKKNMGGELGVEYQLTKTIKVTGSAAYGQYTYDNNPNVKLSVDNIRQIVDFGRSTLKNYKQPGMPQEAYAIGVEYRDPKFWWVGVNANYLDGNYSDISPLLRTDNFFVNNDDQDGFPFPEATEEGARYLLKQEKFDPIRLINLTGGKSWRVKGKTIGFFASVNNVFNWSYKTGGFEQARNANYRELAQDLVAGGENRSFGPKYFYGYGRNYFVNVYINF